MAARKRQSPISTIDYTFSNVDWSAVEAATPATSLPAEQPMPPAATMTAAEAEAAAAMALGQPTNRPRRVGVDYIVEDDGGAAGGGMGGGTAGDGGGTGGGGVNLPDDRFQVITRPVLDFPVQEQKAPRRLTESAKDLIREGLAAYGLTDPQLLQQAYAFYELPDYDTLPEDQYQTLLMKAVKGSAAYQTRFGFLDAVNKTRLEKGQQVLNETDVINLEKSYRDLFKTYSIPTTMYDETSDFKKFIEGDTPPTEVEERLQYGYRLVRQASPDVIDQMKTLYNVDEPMLAAYFLDPARGKDVLIRQAEAVQVAAGAKQGGIQLEASFAERLAAENIRPEKVQQAASTVSQQRQVYQALQAGEGVITEEEALQADLGLSEAAAQRIRQRQRRRVSEFEAGGGFVQTQAGVTGLRTVGQ